MKNYVAQTRIDSPLGTILIARTEKGLAGLWFDEQKWHPGVIDAPWADNDPLLKKAAKQVAEYFSGMRKCFDLPLDLQGTQFQQGVWKALCCIESGSTKTYGDIAREAGSPTAVRAVGAAVGRNPLSVIVPCHRVLGGNGRLTGYAGGLDRKRALLELEGKS